MLNSNDNEELDYSIDGPFVRPSFGWFILYPIAVVLTVSTVLSILTLLLNHSVHIKLQATISLGLTFAVYYLLFAYRYLIWATPIKNVLYYHILSDPNSIYFEFNRFFIQNDVEQGLILPKGMFKKLSQRDLKDVVQEANKVLPIIYK
jgi:hypothetical protein